MKEQIITLILIAIAIAFSTATVVISVTSVDSKAMETTISRTKVLELYL